MYMFSKKLFSTETITLGNSFQKTKLLRISTPNLFTHDSVLNKPLQTKINILTGRDPWISPDSCPALPQTRRKSAKKRPKTTAQDKRRAGRATRIEQAAPDAHRKTDSCERNQCTLSGFVLSNWRPATKEHLGGRASLLFGNALEKDRGTGARPRGFLGAGIWSVAT